MLVAGVDVGNSTTEIAFARLEPGGEPEFLLVLRTASTGAKGSAAAAAGVRELVTRGARRLGAGPGRLLLAEQHPVETDLLELGRLEEIALGGVAVARPASATPSGTGVGVGRLVPLAELAGPARSEPVLVLVGDADFEVVAGRLRDAQARGWRLAGALVAGDDAVLIGNRVDRALPIVDEVADLADLPAGAHAAIEVAPPGDTVAELSDPLRLGVLLGLDPDAARGARHAARAVAGHRTALIVRALDRGAGSGDADAEGPVIELSDGTERPLDPADPPRPVGAVRAVRGAGAFKSGLADAFWCPLPAPPDEPGLRRRLAYRRALGLATLSPGGADELLAALDGLAPRVVTTETDAAVRGAATTPGAGRTPYVLDLGGGTVDLHADRRVVAAGAGELVTRVCAALLGAPAELAERAKRVPSVRVETPFVLHHEDGSRSFRSEPAPPETLARLCAADGRTLRPLPTGLAPEVWRGLRREAKRRVLGANVRRALEAAGGVPRGELVTLVGGCAADREVVEEVAAALGDLDVAVARGDVLGRHGPRAAVAVGLVLRAAADGGRP